MKEEIGYEEMLIQMEEMCKEVNCGREPSDINCKGCLMRILSENLLFWKDRDADLLKKKFENYKSRKEDLIQQAKERLKRSS